MTVVQLLEVLGGFGVDRAEAANLAPDVFDARTRLFDIDFRSALDGLRCFQHGIAAHCLIHCDDAAGAVRCEVFTLHLQAQVFDVFVRARQFAFEVQAAAVDLQECGLGLVVLLLDRALVVFEAVELIAVRGGVFGVLRPFGEDGFEFAAERAKPLLDDVRFEVQVLALEALGGNLVGEPFDRLVVLLAHGDQGAAFAFDRSLAGADIGDGLQGGFAALGGFAQFVFETGHGRAALVAAQRQLFSGGAGLLDLLFARLPFAGDIGLAGADGVHVAAQTKEALTFAFEVEACALEFATEESVCRLGLVAADGELVDGGACVGDLVGAGIGAGTKCFDPFWQLLEFPLAAERALVRAGSAARDHAGGLDVDTIQGDYRAERTLDHAQPGLHVLDHDDAAKQGIDELFEARLAADQLGGDANHPALLLEVEGVDVSDRFEGEELGAAMFAPLERGDRFECG